MKSVWRPAWVVGGMLLVAACSHNAAVVEESAVVRKAPRSAASAAPSAAEAAKPAVGQQYTVEKGDTLYSIAFRYGVDFKTLAALNGIREPYTIFPGQVVTIKSRGQPLAARPRAPASAAVTESARVKPAPVAPPAAADVRPAPVPVKSPPPAVTAAVISPPPPAATPPAIAVERALPSGPIATRLVGGGYWQWPVQGRLLGRFSHAGVGPKGIAVAGNNGDPVRAARDGRVVYTGGSLVGYGQLVIVKHDDVYLSAYAHNSKVLVKEGEAVKAGQKIAEMGSTGTDRTKLHFEVRRNGDPVDPLSVLPPI